jgi:YHS domain-containing protein
MSCRTRILLFALLLTTVTCFSGSLRAADRPWGTDPEKALQTAAQTGRPVFMQFSAPWCPICKRMEKSTLADPAVAARIARSYVPVRVDADRHDDLVKDLEIAGLPTILIVSPELEILHRIAGFQTAEAMLEQLDAAERAAGRARAAVPRRENAGDQSAEPEKVTERPPARRLPAQNASRSRSEEEINKAPSLRAPSISRKTAEQKTKTTKSARNVEELPDDFLQMVEQESQRTSSRENHQGQPSVAGGEVDEVTEDESRTATTRPRSPAAQPRSAPRKPAFAGASLVSAVDDRVIEAGSGKFQTTFRGQTLYFTSERQRRSFEDDPEKYWPALDGCCPLTLLRTDRREPGQLEHAAIFRGQVWLFASDEDMQEFISAPAAVIEDVRNL